MTRMHGVFANFFVVTFLLIFAGRGLAQGHGHDPGDAQPSWPDSLETITLTGTVLVDSSLFHPQRYLDVNNDGEADYWLMLGPFWYQPESGATLPDAGATVTIVGSEEGSGPGHGNLPKVIVFEIDGQQWRDPVAVGSHGWSEPGFWGRGNDTLTVSGTAFVDTTYFYTQYFLDTDGDSVADYKLGFGPHWYEPDNGARRPEHGESITVLGYRHDTMGGFAMLTVVKLNGLDWREAQGPANWGGHWMQRERNDSTYVWCANDSSNYVGFAPDNMRMGMGGMRWPDSVLVEFWKVYPDSLPGGHNVEHFQGYYINVNDPDGESMMGGSSWGGGHWGGEHGRMEFDEDHRVVFRYRDEDIRRDNLDEQGMEVRFWDPVAQSWAPVDQVSVDPNTNTVDFSSKRLDTYYALYAPLLTTDITVEVNTPRKFELLGNYPNPFNPETTIEFELQEQGAVRLDIFSLSGQRVATLVNGARSAGKYHITWNGSDDSGRPLASGIYLVQLRSGNQKVSKRMTLLK